MACNRHKRKQHGEVVPVFRGIASEVKKVVDQLHGLQSISFGEVRKYYGTPKVRIRWGNRVESGPKHVRVEICDPEHGESVLRLRTPHPAAIAWALRRAFNEHKQLANYRG